MRTRNGIGFTDLSMKMPVWMSPKAETATHRFDISRRFLYLGMLVIRWRVLGASLNGSHVRMKNRGFGVGITENL